MGLGRAAFKRTGTYVGCMFTDYMALVRQGHGKPHSGALMTGLFFTRFFTFHISQKQLDHIDCFVLILVAHSS